MYVGGWVGVVVVVVDFQALRAACIVHVQTSYAQGGGGCNDHVQTCYA